MGRVEIGFDAACGVARRASRRIDIRFELGDQVFEVIDLVRQIHGMLLFAGERLFGIGLFFLPRVDQHIQAELLIRQAVEILR